MILCTDEDEYKVLYEPLFFTMGLVESFWDVRPYGDTRNRFTTHNIITYELKRTENKVYIKVTYDDYGNN